MGGRFRAISLVSRQSAEAEAGDALPKMHAIGRAHFEREESLTGAELFDFMQKAAAADGLSFGGEMRHIIGEFPHTKIPGEENTFVIAPENPEKKPMPPRLRDLDENGNIKHWILEVHLIESNALLRRLLRRTDHGLRMSRRHEVNEYEAWVDLSGGNVVLFAAQPRLAWAHHPSPCST